VPKYRRVEISVGVFVLVGCFALAYLSLSVGGLEILPPARYSIHARFANIGDLDQGAPVKLAGVVVGRVGDITLDDYAARVELHINDSVVIPADTIASIRTSGLLGESHVSLSPGASDEALADGGRIMQTEPAVDLIDLLERYALGSTGLEDDEEQSPIRDPLE
jgi:phospholipid/cholesterol/gamma-HCH transport system substrate-binding protein